MPISSVLTTKERRITKTCFRTRSTSKSHYQASLSLYTTSLDFHPRLADLCTPPLRFGWRSPQPNCPPNTVSAHKRIRILNTKKRCFIDAIAGSLLRSIIGIKFPMSSYSKAPGVFLSKCNKAASSQPSQFRQVDSGDSCPLVMPFVRV